MARAFLLAAAGAAVLFLAPSCGGGGDSRDDDTDVVLVAPAVGARDGYIVDSSPTRGVYPNSVPGIQVGDDATDVGARGFLTFYIGALPPPPAVVRAATLRIEQWQVIGAPYDTLGALVIDHIEKNGGLTSSDYDVAALEDTFATVSTDPATGGRTVDVRAQIGADQVAGRDYSTFRLRFAIPTDTDGATDSANFEDVEDHGATGKPPKLTIVYTPAPPTP